MKKLFVIFIILLIPSWVYATDKPMPRVLIALYDSRWESNPRTTFINRFLEMPANHLGYDIQYYDVMAPLPELDDNVAGVILWLNTGTQVPNIDSYLTWLKKVVTQGKKLLVIENGGIGDDVHVTPVMMQRWNEILSYIGVQDDGGWSEITYHANITYMDKDMMEFERKISKPYPPLARFHVLSGSKATSHLRMHITDAGQDDNYDLVTTSPNGGFIGSGYAIYAEDEKKGHEVHFWYINPFLFLKQSLGNALTPIPDVTTLDGKRIFYSHIDGDGWNNITEIEKYNDSNMLSSEVISKEILEPYADFPFNVALITADVDPDCFGVPDSARVAREIFALPNVEPASHTYSHPLYWGFFEFYTPEKEKPLLKYYPPKPSQRFSAVEMLKRDLYGNSWQTPAQEDKMAQKDIMVSRNIAGSNHKRGINDKTEEEILKEYNYTPRSYACSPFNLEQEILGSIETVKSLSPPSKTVRLIQWPGDTGPFEPAIALTRKAGLVNLNGGDSRFDNEYPSYSFVAPIGIRAHNQRQIYASASNEETYTDDWKDRFYGFRYLQATIKNTESPIRVSPFNIYFHMFSGQKPASLGAIKENLEFARAQDIIRIMTSDYASIADGFYATKIIPNGRLSWQILNRGDLQTIRFDDAGDYEVDFDRSNGVMGANFYQNSLYVSLDPAVSAATVALQKKEESAMKPKHEFALVKSSWRVKNLRQEKDGITFDSGGYGPGVMIWTGKPNNHYIIQANTGGKTSESTATAESNGLFSISLSDPAPNQPMAVLIRKIGN